MDLLVSCHSVLNFDVNCLDTNIYAIMCVVCLSLCVVCPLLFV
jgi:hypothetical protein